MSFLNFTSAMSCLRSTIFLLGLFLGLSSVTHAEINYQLYQDFPSGPVGGGVGYEGRVLVDDSYVQVECAATQPEECVKNLRTYLADPTVTRIHIPDSPTFEVDSPFEITTTGLILTGDRGALEADGRVSPGALFLLNNICEDSEETPRCEHDELFKVKADEVRISGLRLAAKNKEFHSYGVILNTNTAIADKSLEVDNCELYHWGHSAVLIRGHSNDSSTTVTGRVHHNYIHDNSEQLGYGTSVLYKNAFAVIAYNLYKNNRHSVAAQGRGEERYTAAYNLTLGNPISVEYDMHGYSDYNKKNCAALQACAPYNSCNEAGTEVILLNNAALNLEYPFFKLRGIPRNGAYVTNNFYSVSNGFRLWRTFTHADTEGPCELAPPKDANIHLPESDWSTYGLHVWDNHLDPNGRYVQYVSWSGKTRWSPLFFNAYEPEKTALGDFNGDGVTDLFYANGSRWYVSWSGVTPWEKLNVSGHLVPHLRFGDFNGDGKTDVFRATGSRWYVSWGGTSGWSQLNASSAILDGLHFGDFNGDGKTDVFRATGSRWYVSWGGTSRWVQLNSSSVSPASLAFGDFNGDGKTDVFRATGSRWYVSWGGTSRWSHLAYSAYTRARLAFADFDGDGKTDVFRATGAQWYVSSGGTASWATLAGSTYTLELLTFGDFNGDGRADVVRDYAF